MLKNLKAKLKNRKGFTLIELVIVIAIIAILLAIAIPAFMSYMQRAQRASDDAIIRIVQNGAAILAAEGRLVPADTADPVVIVINNDPVEENGINITVSGHNTTVMSAADARSELRDMINDVNSTRFSARITPAPAGVILHSTRENGVIIFDRGLVTPDADSGNGE